MSDSRSQLLDEDEPTYIDMLRDYECPDGCDFLYLLSEDEAMGIVGGDSQGFLRCPLCEEELEQTIAARLDTLAMVADVITNAQRRDHLHVEWP